jgi:soluble lytic murein transglycosylase-like protein
MQRTRVLAAILTAAALVPAARADYAVLRSGLRLHITAYQQTGDHVVLTVAGGTVQLAASDIVAIEPEEVFAPNAPAPAADTGPFADVIRRAGTKHGVDENLIHSVIAAESNFNPRAVSPKDAQGLMQLLPETAARYAVANVFDPAQNIEAGTHYLKDLLEQYRGNLPLALAAYNAGPEMVQRYGGIPPFRETQNYIRRVTAELAEVKRKSGTSQPLGLEGVEAQGRKDGQAGSKFVERNQGKRSADVGEHANRAALNRVASEATADLAAVSAAGAAAGSPLAPAPDQHPDRP